MGLAFAQRHERPQSFFIYPVRMLAPPSLKEVPRYPITAGVGILTLIVTGMWWCGQPIDWLFVDYRVFAKWELWRALTSTLPHLDFFHLAFNLYWFWVFGTLVEREYGHLKCAGIYLLLAFGASLAEFALFNGCVGLSGVGYGLWSLLWILGQRDARFADAIDYQTTRLFIIWFFLCIVLTATNVMHIGNVAHGMGAVLGILLGLAMSGSDDLKLKAKAGLAVLVVLIFLGGTVFWPQVNFSKNAEAEVEHAGYDALKHNDNRNAVKWLELASRMNHAPARAWYNLGIAYQRTRRNEEAIAAYNRAASLPDANPQLQQEAQEMATFLSIGTTYHSAPLGKNTNSAPNLPSSPTNR